MKQEKGIVVSGIIAIVLGAGIAIASVLIFFYVFKVSIDLQMREHYIWNKVQELPLNLFSMDLDDGSFVSKMNKVYYGYETKEELQKVEKILNEQLYYTFSEKPEHMGYIVSVDTITLSKFPLITECGCIPDIDNFGTWICKDKCTISRAGKSCTRYDIQGTPVQAPELCFEFGRIQYSGEFPFPLTFSGTDEFTVTMSYNALEYK